MKHKERIFASVEKDVDVEKRQIWSPRHAPERKTCAPSAGSLGGYCASGTGNKAASLFFLAGWVADGTESKISAESASELGLVSLSAVSNCIRSPAGEISGQMTGDGKLLGIGLSSKPSSDGGKSSSSSGSGSVHSCISSGSGQSCISSGSGSGQSTSNSGSVPLPKLLAVSSAHAFKLFTGEDALVGSNRCGSSTVTFGALSTFTRLTYRESRSPDTVKYLGTDSSSSSKLSKCSCCSGGSLPCLRR